MKKYVDIASIKEVRGLQLKEVGVLLSEKSAFVLVSLSLKTGVESAQLDMGKEVDS